MSGVNDKRGEGMKQMTDSSRRMRDAGKEKEEGEEDRYVM